MQTSKKLIFKNFTKTSFSERLSDQRLMISLENLCFHEKNYVKSFLRGIVGIYGQWAAELQALKTEGLKNFQVLYPEDGIIVKV